MADQITVVQKKLSPILEGQAKAHINAQPYAPLGSNFTDFNNAVALFSRKQLLKDLQKLHGSSRYTSGQWVSKKSQMEYLAAMERDMRSRYRSRMDCMRSGSLDQNFTDTSLTAYAQDVTAIAT